VPDARPQYAGTLKCRSLRLVFSCRVDICYSVPPQARELQAVRQGWRGGGERHTQARSESEGSRGEQVQQAYKLLRAEDDAYACFYVMMSGEAFAEEQGGWRDTE